MEKVLLGARRDNAHRNDMEENALFVKIHFHEERFFRFYV